MAFFERRTPSCSKYLTRYADTGRVDQAQIQAARRMSSSRMSRVVPAMGETIARSLSSRAFIREDFPHSASRQSKSRSLPGSPVHCERSPVRAFFGKGFVNPYQLLCGDELQTLFGEMTAASKIAAYFR